MLFNKAFILFILTGIFLLGTQSYAQSGLRTAGAGYGIDSLNQADSNQNTSGWIDYKAVIYYTTLNSDIPKKPDTDIYRFQYFHKKSIHPEYSDLGHYGTSAKSLFFIPPNNQPGLSLGYHSFDYYKTDLDSIRFYNTTNPYSEFSFLMGSKSLQLVNLLHTQNINPRWNFAANLASNTSQGFYTAQTSKSFKSNFSTNYASKNQRYQLKAIVLYDNFLQDENGGIKSDSFLNLSNFSERKRIPTEIPSLAMGRNRARVNNRLSNFDFYIQNNYSWGKNDTTYNEDSTKRSISFTPRFRVQYDFQIHNESHYLNDFLPDSLRYAPIAPPISFDIRDTLLGKQSWTYIKNNFSLNGFIGKNQNVMKIQAGVGNQIDLFSALLPNGKNKENSFNTYLFGNILKEAYNPKQWAYTADAQIYLTGKAIGDFKLNIDLNKQLNDWIGFYLNFNQSLAEAPYAYRILSSNFFEQYYQFDKTSVTQFNSGLNIPKLKIKINASYSLLANYLYFDNTLTPQQEKQAVSIMQLYGSNTLNLKNFYLFSHVAWQQNLNNGPIHFPAFTINEQLGYQNFLFKKALKINTGISVRYASAYYTDSYSPILNQFINQSDYLPTRTPSFGAFFNFGLKQFRAFVSFDEIQQLLWRNNINFTGHPAEDLTFRFGFKWLLIN